jgi:hypothetical protein
LIKKLLNLNPQKRPHAKEILEMDIIQKFKNNPGQLNSSKKTTKTMRYKEKIKRTFNKKKKIKTTKEIPRIPVQTKKRYSKSINTGLKKTPKKLKIRSNNSIPIKSKNRINIKTPKFKKPETKSVKKTPKRKFKFVKKGNLKLTKPKRTISQKYNISIDKKAKRTRSSKIKERRKLRNGPKSSKKEMDYSQELYRLYVEINKKKKSKLLSNNK